MKSRIASLFLCTGVAALALACGGEEENNPPAEIRCDTPSKVLACLDGKVLTMTGQNIPSHPNGFNEHVNFGAATQCYHNVEMRLQAGVASLKTQVGTLNNAPNTGDVGECDRATRSAELSFVSTAVQVENVQGNGECFDFTITFPGFAQEGRGSIDLAGKRLKLELFFKDQAAGHRCADGAVGARSVTLNMAPFTGDAVQTYAITEE